MTHSHDHTAVFESHRQHLLAVAQRILDNQADAEDAVQDAWLRFARSDPAAITNVGGWLTTCVTRLCLDRLRQRSPLPLAQVESRRDDDAVSPETAALLAVDIEAALTVVLDRLTPAQRVALILHDVFDLSFDVIGEMLGVRAEAARRQASRARARVRGTHHLSGVAPEDAAVVQAFVGAAGSGDVSALATALHPEIIRTADPQAVPGGAALTLEGRRAVTEESRLMVANARRARMAWLGERPVAVVGPLRQPQLVLTFVVQDRKILRYDVAADPHRVAALGRHLTGWM